MSGKVCLRRRTQLAGMIIVPAADCDFAQACFFRLRLFAMPGSNAGENIGNQRRFSDDEGSCDGEDSGDRVLSL
jgi:hypothetical protein